MPGPHQRVEEYYSRAVTRHGPTALGVDWRNAPSQYLRFVQLLKLCDFSAPFSLNDFGCGYGALLAFLDERHAGVRIDYDGIDLSPAMIAAAQSLWRDKTDAGFAVDSRCRRAADYSLASGVFNVRLGWPVAEWETYVASILGDLRDNSARGFAVNFMLPLESGPSEEGLYRTLPDPWIDFCTGKLGCTAELLTDYGLREFTLLART